MKKYISMMLGFVLAFSPVSAFAVENSDTTDTAGISLFIESMYENTDLSGFQQKASEKMLVDNKIISLDAKMILCWNCSC